MNSKVHYLSAWTRVPHLFLPLRYTLAPEERAINLKGYRDKGESGVEGGSGIAYSVDATAYARPDQDDQGNLVWKFGVDVRSTQPEDANTEGWFMLFLNGKMYTQGSLEKENGHTYFGSPNHIYLGSAWCYAPFSFSGNIYMDVHVGWLVPGPIGWVNPLCPLGICIPGVTPFGYDREVQITNQTGKAGLWH